MHVLLVIKAFTKTGLWLVGDQANTNYQQVQMVKVSVIPFIMETNALITMANFYYH